MNKTNAPLKPPRIVKVFLDLTLNECQQHRKSLSSGNGESQFKKKRLSNGICGHTKSLNILDAIKEQNTDIHLHMPPKLHIKSLSVPLCHKFGLPNSV